MNVWGWTAIVVFAPLILWIIFRIASAAIFRSWFELKNEHETKKKEEV